MHNYIWMGNIYIYMRYIHSYILRVILAKDLNVEEKRI